MLTQEALFTVLLSCLLYREHIDRRVGLAIVLLALGGGLLVFDRAGNGATQVIGLLAVTGATISWAVDNTLSRTLADLDPGRVVVGKASVGAACSFLFAGTTGTRRCPDGFSVRHGPLYGCGNRVRTRGTGT